MTTNLPTFSVDQVDLLEVSAKAFGSLALGGGDAARLRLAELGLGLMLVDEEHGGLGMDELDAVLVLEEMGYAGLPTAASEVVGLVAPVLAEFGSDAQRARWLPLLESGRWAGAWCPSSGAPDLRGDEPIIVTRGTEAFVVDRALLDSRSDLSSEDRLADGASTAVARRGALVSSAVLSGTARRLLDEGVGYATVREQFAVPIGTFQAVRHMLADVATAVESARTSVWSAARAMAEEREDVSVLVHVAKIAAGRAGSLANDHVLQVHGGIGFTLEHPLHQWLTAGREQQFRWGEASWHERELARRSLPGGDLLDQFMP